jgi:RNA polymerase sigma factor (sigma-70 family)
LRRRRVSIHEVPVQLAIVKDIHHSLVERCKKGDRKAQYKLYRLYAKAMFNIAMRITNDYMEAEDVLQEAFVRAFRKLESFKGDATFGAWLKRIVVNTAINQLRKKRLEFKELDEEKLEIPDEKSPERDCQWEMSEIRQAIASLPEGYRVVFSLYCLEGYDHAEIASILEISEATSKSQYSRAKKKLRNILQSKQDL